MFATTSAFLAFFIPAAILIVLGLLFEEHLIDFEQKIKRRLFCKKTAAQNTGRTPAAPARMKRLDTPKRSASDDNCAA